MVQLIIPIITAFLFNMVIGTKPKNIKLAVLNNEISLSHCLNYTFTNCFMDEYDIPTLSCSYVHYLQKEHYQFVGI